MTIKLNQIWSGHPGNAEFKELIRLAAAELDPSMSLTTTNLRDYWVTIATYANHATLIIRIERYLNVVDGVADVAAVIEESMAAMSDEDMEAAASRSDSGALPNPDDATAKILAKNRCLAVLLGTLFLGAGFDGSNGEDGWTPRQSHLSGGSCVIATHAVSTGAFSPEAKERAVQWCVKNLHGTWYGEAFRRGYRDFGNKLIISGKVETQGYQEFQDYMDFVTGKKRTLKTTFLFVRRTIQFFLKGLFIK